jgi:hypothetical protein
VRSFPFKGSVEVLAEPGIVPIARGLDFGGPPHDTSKEWLDDDLVVHDEVNAGPIGF